MNYAIIYWSINNNEVYPVLKPDGQLALWDSLREADKQANKIKESRVISIEGVKE